MALLFIDPVSRYARMTYNALSPLLDYALRKDLLAYQQSLKEQALRRRMEQAEQIGRELAQALDVSPTNTYVLGQPSFQLQAPELNISPVMGVREKIGEGLLSSGLMDSAFNVNLPQQTSFVDILKSPAEYTDALYQTALPIVTKALPLDINLSPMLTAQAKTYQQEYTAREKERREREKLLRDYTTAKTFIRSFAKRRKRKLTDEDIDVLALGMASGTLKRKDIADLINYNTAIKQIELDTGEILTQVFDRDTGELLKTYRVKPDLELLRRRKEIERQPKKQASGMWKDVQIVQPIEIAGEVIDYKKVPLEVEINGERFKIQLHSKENRGRAISLERPWVIIDLDKSQIEKLLNKQRSVEKSGYSTIDDPELVGP